MWPLSRREAILHFAENSAETRRSRRSISCKQRTILGCNRKYHRCLQPGSSIRSDSPPPLPGARRSARWVVLSDLAAPNFGLPVLTGPFRFVALEAAILNKAMSLVVVASALPFRAGAVPIELVASGDPRLHGEAPFMPRNPVVFPLTASTVWHAEIRRQSQQLFHWPADVTHAFKYT